MTRSPVSRGRGENLMLEVRIAEVLHALPISRIEEVLPSLPIDPIPQCPAFVKGVVFVRGHLIPVLDARERLGLREEGRWLDPHIVCLRIGERLVGIEVDEAVDLIEVDPGEIIPAEKVGSRGGFFRGLIERDGHVIHLLDPEKLLAEEEAEALQKARNRGQDVVGPISH